MKSASGFAALLRKLLLACALVLLLGGAGWGVWYWRSGAQGAVSYRTERVSRGDLTAVINATGTVEPVEVIDVGAQVTGQIKEFGKDLDNSTKNIDYRSRVEPGTVLAKIDDSLYLPDVGVAEADLRVAEADVKVAEAALESAKAKLYQTDRDWERAKRMGPTGALTGVDYDTIQNAYVTSKVLVPSAEAALEKAKKTVEHAKQVLLKAQKNLSYCTIRSPVKGVIIDRRVNIGQTVVSSLTASSMFLIATDLQHMQVWAAINEADIGGIRRGQLVTFTVDAHPGETFTGKVSQIRYNATSTQNVVTYTVVVDTDNISDPRSPDELKLKPYMTANLQFQVDQRKDVLLVPNAALRFKPKPAQIAPEFRTTQEQDKRRKAMNEENNPNAPKGRGSRATVWVQDGEFVRPVKVRVGLTDGNMTELIEVLGGDKLAPDAELITSEDHQGSGSKSNNPFAAQMFGGKKQQ
jgi:HlyD family secretion protein